MIFYVRYIVLSYSNGGGEYGIGDTMQEAMREFHQAGGKSKQIRFIYKFTADVPFAPSSQPVARDDQADAWVGRDGSVSWIRCRREQIDPATVKA